MTSLVISSEYPHRQSQKPSPSNDDCDNGTGSSSSLDEKAHDRIDGFHPYFGHLPGRFVAGSCACGFVWF